MLFVIFDFTFYFTFSSGVGILFILNADLRCSYNNHLKITLFRHVSNYLLNLISSIEKMKIKNITIHTYKIKS